MSAKSTLWGIATGAVIATGAIGYVYTALQDSPSATAGDSSSSAVGGKEAPWFQKENAGCQDWRHTDQSYAGNPYQYDDAGNIVGSFTLESGRLTCVLTTIVCGDFFFKGKEINRRAGERCPIIRTSQKMVCCDDWMRAKESRKPCDPLQDADCDGVANKDDDTPVGTRGGEDDSPAPGRSGVVAAADLELIVRVPPSIRVGQPTAFAAEIRNHGPGDALSVVLTSAVSSGAIVSASSSHGSCSTGGSSARCELGTVTKGLITSINIMLRAEAEGEIAVSADVVSAVPDPNMANNHAVAATAGRPADPAVLEER